MTTCRKRSRTARETTLQRRAERAAKYTIVDRRRAGKDGIR
jgi:hypothetical protein